MRTKFLLFLYLLYAAAASVVVFGGTIAETALEEEEPEPFIVGGSNAKPGEFPYLVSIQLPREDDGQLEHICGGSIIDPRWVLTAAHCSFPRELGAYAILGGAFQLSKPTGFEQTVFISEMFVHPAYNTTTTENDIALYRVDPPFKVSSSVKTIALPPTGLVTKDATVAGWGATSEGGPGADVLQKVSVSQVAQKTCAKDYEGRDKIVPTMVCYAKPGKDSCQGDSGGPLKCCHGSGTSQLCHICGIVSFGIGCAEPNFPGVYTRVTLFRNWIRKTINDNPPPEK